MKEKNKKKMKSKIKGSKNKGTKK